MLRKSCSGQRHRSCQPWPFSIKQPTIVRKSIPAKYTGPPNLTLGIGSVKSEISCSQTSCNSKALIAKHQVCAVMLP